MKKVIVLVLLAIFGTAAVVPVQAQNRISVEEHDRQVRKTQKKQQKAMKKATKKQNKAMKKSAKAQRKALQKTQQRATH